MRGHSKVGQMRAKVALPATVVLLAGAAFALRAPIAGAALAPAAPSLVRAESPAIRVPPQGPRVPQVPHPGVVGSRVSVAPGSPPEVAKIRSTVAPGLVDIDTVLGHETTEEAAGTGMVLTSTGRVLTNNHVIEGATKISATDLGNGRTYAARVLGYSPTRDVAVLQLVGASKLTTVHLGDPSKLTVGEAVVGIGNAGGLGGEPSAAGGSVTALDEAITAGDAGSSATSVEHLSGLVETNAGIEPGDSGGPLVTAAGAVVGMDTAGSGDQGQGQGPGFGTPVQSYSIPIDAAMTTVAEIVGGKATPGLHIGATAFLGVYVSAVHGTGGSTPFGSTPLGATPFGSTPLGATPSGASAPLKGALVVGVVPGSPALRSGIAATDVITAAGGVAVASPEDLSKVMLSLRPGTSVEISWVTSSGQSMSATVTMANGPPQ